MRDEKPLRAAIIADPIENTQRLAYADWLQENGQEDRAIFIRLQIERNILQAKLAAMPKTPRTKEARGTKATLQKKVASMLAQENGMLEAHREEWVRADAQIRNDGEKVRVTGDEGEGPARAITNEIIAAACFERGFSDCFGLSDNIYNAIHVHQGNLMQAVVRAVGDMDRGTRGQGLTSHELHTLRQHGLDMNGNDGNGRILLYLLVDNNLPGKDRTALLDYALRQGANPNQPFLPDFLAGTYHIPFSGMMEFLAVDQKDETGLFRLFARYGARSNIENGDGQTAESIIRDACSLGQERAIMEAIQEGREERRAEQKARKLG